MEPRLLFVGPPAIQQVASHFVNVYYRTLRQNPELVLNTFYRASSTITRAEVGNDGTVGSEMSVYDLEKKLKTTDFGGCLHTDIFTVDSQKSIMGGILVNVTGSTSIGHKKRRSFVQTFFLVPQEVGYFVQNDIFRYLDREEYSETISFEPAAAHVDSSVVFLYPESGSSLSPKLKDQEVNATLVVDKSHKSGDNATPPWVKVVVEEIVCTEQEVSPLISTPYVEVGAKETISLVGAEQEAGLELMVPASTPEMELAAEEIVRLVKIEKENGTTSPTEVELVAKEVITSAGHEQETTTTCSTSDLSLVTAMQGLPPEDDNIQESGTPLQPTVLDEQFISVMGPYPSADQTLEEVPKRFNHSWSYASVLRVKEVARSTFPSTPSATSSTSSTGPRVHHSQASHSHLPRVFTTSQRVLEKLKKISSSAVDEQTVYIKNLPAVGTSTSELEVELRQFGLIKAGGVTLKGQNDGVCYAFVQFKDSASANAAIESSPISFGGRPVYICKKRSASRTEGVRPGHGPGRRGQ